MESCSACSELCFKTSIKHWITHSNELTSSLNTIRWAGWSELISSSTNTSSFSSQSGLAIIEWVVVGSLDGYAVYKISSILLNHLSIQCLQYFANCHEIRQFSGIFQHFGIPDRSLPVDNKCRTFGNTFHFKNKGFIQTTVFFTN